MSGLTTGRGQPHSATRRLAEGEAPALASYPQGALLQPFVQASFGEVCLIYLAGRYSHAARRRLAPGEWRANSAYGAQIESVTPRPEWLACAEAALRCLPEPPLYARVDGLISEGGGGESGFSINEVELIEPALYPQLRPAFARELAAALASRLAS